MSILFWLRGVDLNHWPDGYEPSELTRLLHPAIRIVSWFWFVLAITIGYELLTIEELTRLLHPAIRCDALSIITKTNNYFKIKDYLEIFLIFFPDKKSTHCQKLPFCSVVLIAVVSAVSLVLFVESSDRINNFSPAEPSPSLCRTASSLYSSVL